MARGKLGGASRRVAGEEDVVLDALNALFSGVGEGRFPKLQDRKSLWPLLVSITEHKAIDLIRRNNAEGRGVVGSPGTPGLVSSGPGIEGVIDGEPSPSFVAVWSEEFASLLRLLSDEDESLKQVAVDSLGGYKNKEIAERPNIGLRSVEWKLALVRQIWSEALG